MKQLATIVQARIDAVQEDGAPGFSTQVLRLQELAPAGASYQLLDGDLVPRVRETDESYAEATDVYYYRQDAPAGEEGTADDTNYVIQ